MYSLDSGALPYPGGYMQPFFPMPPGYSTYNPFFNMGKLMNLNLIVNFWRIFCLAAPPYPMGGAPQYPQQGKTSFIRKKSFVILWFRLWCW